MKRVIATLLACFITVAQAVADDTAKLQLQAKLKNLTTYSANFRQLVTDKEGTELQEAEGKLYLSQPQRLHWESLPPNELQLIADGQTLWHIDPFVEQVVAIDQTRAAQNHPIMLLAQPDSSQWQQYMVEQADEGSYLLTSLATEGDFVSLTIKFNGENLVGISILDKMDQLNRFDFSQVTQNITLDPTLFVFSLPDGYELDDQR